MLEGLKQQAEAIATPSRQTLRFEPALPLKELKKRWTRPKLLGEGPRSVLDAETADLTFSSQDLPAFASLRQSILTLAPARTDQGAYSITISVNDGKETAHQSFAVAVARTNGAPKVDFEPGSAWMGDSLGGLHQCPGFLCLLEARPYISPFICDPEADDVVVDVEVVEHGLSFTGTPTISERFSHVPLCGISVIKPQLDLPLLPAGRWYDFNLRVSDVLGAAATINASPAGWSGPYQYWQGPCAPGQTCACIPGGNQWACFRPSDCCSGSCSAETPDRPSTCK